MQSPALPTDPSTLPLRDIHLPEGVGWWPPAPGWWLLPVLLLLGLAVLWYSRLLYRRRRYSAVNMAKQELAGIRSRYDTDHDAVHCARAISALLRRVSISLFPRVESAGLTGREWLEFLGGRGDGTKESRRETVNGDSTLVRHTGQGLSGIQTQGSEPAALEQSSEYEKRRATGLIPEHIGMLLLEAPYRHQVAEAEVDALYDFCSDWLERLTRSKP